MKLESMFKTILVFCFLNFYFVREVKENFLFLSYDITRKLDYLLVPVYLNKYVILLLLMDTT